VRNGDHFVGSNGDARVLTKNTQAAFAKKGIEPYLGLKIDDIGMSGHLLAEKRLAHGDDADPAQVKAAAPPQGSAPQTGGIVIRHLS
jgi:hypothetical protein